MSTGYKINNQDIDEIFESFPLDVTEQYHVINSKFTSNDTSLLLNGKSIKESCGKVFPISARNHLGGYNECNQLRVNGVPIDVALKGCRPIGIPLMRLGPGTHFLNRIDGKTWVSSLPNSASGTLLEYNPKYLHVELLGGGGGGAGSAPLYASAGGGGGAYCYTTLEIPDNSYFELVVGNKGVGGSARSNGQSGENTLIRNSQGIELCCARGGAGGEINTGNGGNGGTASGGIVNINGGNGGKRENGGYSVALTKVPLDKPEGDTWERGNTTGGSSNGNGYGGGGGASAFSNGAHANSNTTPAGASFGAGGAGAGFRVATASNGGDGGEGFINLYY